MRRTSRATVETGVAVVIIGEPELPTPVERLKIARWSEILDFRRRLRDTAPNAQTRRSASKPSGETLIGLPPDLRVR
jgi:hypothetical protein